MPEATPEMIVAFLTGERPMTEDPDERAERLDRKAAAEKSDWRHSEAADEIKRLRTALKIIIGDDGEGMMWSERVAIVRAALHQKVKP